jgi:hypothetical protein
VSGSSLGLNELAAGRRSAGESHLGYRDQSLAGTWSDGQTLPMLTGVDGSRTRALVRVRAAPGSLATHF